MCSNQATCKQQPIFRRVGLGPIPAIRGPLFDFSDPWEYIINTATKNVVVFSCS